MSDDGCAFCGGEVHRTKSRGEPFKYCTPECDKAAMSLRLRKFLRKVETVQRSNNGEGWKLLSLECGHRVDILLGDALVPEKVKCRPCEAALFPAQPALSIAYKNHRARKQ